MADIYSTYYMDCTVHEMAYNPHHMWNIQRHPDIYLNHVSESLATACSNHAEDMEKQYQAFTELIKNDVPAAAYLENTINLFRR